MRSLLLAELSLKAPYITKIYENCAFLYSDLKNLDDTSLQKMLQMVPTKRWLLAFKLTDEPLKKLLLSNMSKTRREDFLDSFKRQDKVKKALVIKVQMEIARKAREELESGRMRLRGKKAAL